MRVLFYGGCHGAALRRIFERFGRGLTHVDHLTNFQLIRKQLPVPYEQFRAFDVVVFSPIRNKGDYNTAHLEDYLSAHGVRFIKFPWLQWEGYFPGMSRVRFPWYSGWWPSALETAGDRFGTFEAFRAAVYDGAVLNEETLRHFDLTTERLRIAEEDCDVRVVDFILETFRNRRVFLTPDHAGIELYKHVASQIAQKIGCTLDPAFLKSTDLPRVKGFGTYRLLALHRGNPQIAALGMRLVHLYNRHWSLGQSVEGAEPEDEKTSLDGAVSGAAMR